MQLVNKDTNNTNLGKTEKGPKLAHELAHEKEPNAYSHKSSVYCSYPEKIFCIYTF